MDTHSNNIFATILNLGGMDTATHRDFELVNLVPNPAPTSNGACWAIKDGKQTIACRVHKTTVMALNLDHGITIEGIQNGFPLSVAKGHRFLS